MNKPLKTPPPYAIASVDHALRVAVMLQLEDGLTVSEVAERLGVARSTAHRLLAMLVYRDFAAQDENHLYRAGPVLELAAHSQSRVSSLRAAALPHLRRLVDLLEETANLAIRTGDTVRFIASAECRQALRVGSREGMVFPPIARRRDCYCWPNSPNPNWPRSTPRRGITTAPQNVRTSRRFGPNCCVSAARGSP